MTQREPIAAGGPTPPAAGDRDDLTPLELRELAKDVLGRAIARYDETAALAKRSGELSDIDPRLERWHEFEVRAALDAQTELLRVVMMTDGRAEYRGGPCLEKYRRPACGVASGGRLFLAIPDPYRDETDVGGRISGPDKMLLVVMDRAGIVDAACGLPPESFTPARRPA